MNEDQLVYYNPKEIEQLLKIECYRLILESGISKTILVNGEVIKGKTSSEIRNEAKKLYNWVKGR